MLQRMLVGIIGIMGAVVIVLAGAVLWFLVLRPAETVSAPTAPTLMTDWVAVTPNGELQWHHNGQTRILRTDVATHTATLPVLAQDGTQIAFVRAVGAQMAVSLLSLADNRVTDVYVDVLQPVSMLHWSPDGTYIAFVVDSNTVYVAPSSAQTAAVRIAYGAPAFLDWNPDSLRLLVKIGGIGRDGGMLGVYDVRDNRIHDAHTDVGDFHSAQWDVRGDGYFYVADAATRSDSQDAPQAVVRYQHNDGTVTTIAEEGPATIRLLPAPQGDQLAYIVSRSDERLIRIWRNGSVVTVADNSPLTAWWSPNARQLACLTVVDDTQLQWQVIDVLDGTTRTLSTFAPNDAMIDVLHYFDGTAYTPWSADGQWLMTITNDIVQAQAISGGGVVPLGPGTYAQWAPATVLP